MGRNSVVYEKASSILARGPSPVIWADCPVITFERDPSRGVHMLDDFKNSIVGKETASGTDFTSGIGYIDGDINWYAYATSSKLADVAIQSDEDGVLMLDQDGTDDDVSVITSGGNITGAFTITDAQTKKFWYEARFKVSTITNTDLGVFVGLTEEGQAASAKPMGAASAIGDIDHIGFHVFEADGDGLDFVYTLSGQADGVTADVHTLVVDTYVRVGLKFEPSDNKMHVYVNGVENQNAAVLASASNFPSGEKLALTVAISSGAAGADGDNLKLDWVRVAQEY